MERKGTLHLAPEDVEALLGNWLGLNADIMDLTPGALIQLIEVERAGRRRTQVLLRLHGRFNRLRGLDERQKLLSGAPWRDNW